MFNYVIGFFVLALAAGFFGFGGPAGMFAPLVQLMALIFMALFFGSIFYHMLGMRKRSPQLD